MGMIVDLASAIVMGIRMDSFMHIDIDMPMLIGSNISLIQLDRLKKTGYLDPTTVQNRSKNNPTWCQNRAQDGFLGIRVVKRRSWTSTTTTTPIHEAVSGGFLGSC